MVEESYAKICRVASIELANIENREFVILEILSKIKNYDYIIIDCPPAMEKARNRKSSLIMDLIFFIIVILRIIV